MGYNVSSNRNSVDGRNELSPNQIIEPKMLKPNLFRHPFLASRNIPYVCGEPGGRGSMSGGVLQQGQIVWVKDHPSAAQKALSVAGFVDGVGVVSLNPQWLIPVSKNPIAIQ